MNIITATAARELEEHLHNFKDISARLRNGEFITRHHHAAFREMRDHHEAYTSIFNLLGEDLRYHQAGFYYIYEDDAANLSERAKSFVVVALSLIEQIGDRGSDPTQLIDEQTVLSDDFLDDVLRDQSKHLRPLNLHHHADFHKMLSTMAKLGILAYSEESFNPGIKLYPAFHIYVDACRNIGVISAQQPTTHTNHEDQA